MMFLRRIFNLSTILYHKIPISQPGRFAGVSIGVLRKLVDYAKFKELSGRSQRGSIWHEA